MSNVTPLATNSCCRRSSVILTTRRATLKRTSRSSYTWLKSTRLWASRQRLKSTEEEWSKWTVLLRRWVLSTGNSTISGQDPAGHQLNMEVCFQCLSLKRHHEICTVGGTLKVAQFCKMFGNTKSQLFTTAHVLPEIVIWMSDFNEIDFSEHYYIPLKVQVTFILVPCPLRRGYKGGSAICLA